MIVGVPGLPWTISHEPFGTREERAKEIRLEQVDVERVRGVRPNEGGFPRTPWPAEEETLRFDSKKSSDRFHLEPHYGKYRFQFVK